MNIFTKCLAASAAAVIASVPAAAGLIEIENATVMRDGKPFFPLGLVFGITDEALQQAKASGFNSVHQEYSMLDVFPDGPEVSAEGIELIKSYHKNAAANDMVYFPLINGHYIPHWLGAKAGKRPVDVTGSNIGIWFPHSMHNPEYRKALAAYWQAVMEAVGDDPNTGAFVMWNEPGYGLDVTEYAIALYREKIAEEFKTIDLFNKKYGTEFADFAEVMPPASVEENRAFFYDWMLYNIQAHADFFSWEAAELKKHVPDVMLTNKHPVPWISGDAAYCNDIVLHAQYQDIYGCDFYGGSIYHYRNAMEMARSNNPQGPVITYETHAQRSMPALDPDIAAAQMFAQVLGGARGIFFFCAGENVAGYSFYSDTATPPPVRKAFEKLFHLINDNQWAFAAPRRQAKIAVLTALPSTVHYGGSEVSAQKDFYSKRVTQAYDLLRNQHFAVDFISSRLLGSKLDKYELLVIPSFSILSEADLKTVAEFHKNGGKIMAFANSLSRDEAFAPVPPPQFLGISGRNPSPWNRASMRLTEVAPELVPYFPAEIIVDGPEIVNPAPMADLIPGYIVDSETKDVTWLAANQDAYASIIQSTDKHVVYCAFDSLYSEGLSQLVGGIVQEMLDIPREAVIRKKNNQETESHAIMCAISEYDSKSVMLLANSGPQSGIWTVTPDDDAKAWIDLVTGIEYVPDENGTIEIQFERYGYAVLTEK